MTRSRTTGRFLFALVLAGQLAFWAGLSLAARHYPSEYDWRYMTISSLLYSDRDPGGHRFAQAGVVFCGLTGLAWALALARVRNVGAAARRGTGIVGFGYFCMALSASVPQGIGSIRKSHEIISLAAFFALCIGLSQLTWTFARLLAAMAFVPIAFAAVTQTYVHWALPDLPWVNLEWRARGIPFYLSFAFWQWTASGAYSLLTLALAWRDCNSHKINKL